MAQQFRKKKTDDGRVVTYPVGTSKQSADGLARTLHNLYPDETIKVVRLGKGKDMFAPFFAYVGKRMSDAFPLEKPAEMEIRQEKHVYVSETPKNSDWFSRLPKSTFKALADFIAQGSTIYSVINGSSVDGKRMVKGDVTIFGSAQDGSLSYVVEWPHMSDVPEPSVGVYNDQMEKDITDPVEATALRARVLSSVDGIRNMHRFSADLRDNEAKRIVELLDRIPSGNEIIGIRYANDQITVYPIDHGNDVVTVNAQARNRNHGEARTFMKASTLRGMLNMLIDSGSPNMIIGIGTGDPVYGEIKLYPDDPYSYFGSDAPDKRKAYKEIGQLSIVAAPADSSETRAIDLINYMRAD